jgi:hypothetical protein
VKPPAARFVTFRLKDSDKTMKNIGPFYLQKALDSVAGKVTNASRLKNGTLDVEARNEKQAEVLLKATPWITSRARGKTHVVELLRGVIRTDSLDGMSDEEIRSALADSLSAGVQINCEEGQQTVPSAHHLSDIRGAVSACVPACRV